MSVDPKAEKYAGWSPYVYTLDNPLKFNDPTGEAAYIVLSGNQSPQPTLQEIKQEFVKDAQTSALLFATGQTEMAIGNLALGVLEAVGSLDPHGVTGLGNPMAGLTKISKITQIEKATERGLRNQAKVLKEMGLEKNTQKLKGTDPFTKMEGKTIPDAIDKKGNLVEIKDRATVSNTKQLRIQKNIAEKRGVKLRLIVGKNTEVSKNAKKGAELERRSDLGPKE